MLLNSNPITSGFILFLMAVLFIGLFFMIGIPAYKYFFYTKKQKEAERMNEIGDIDETSIRF